MILTNDLKHDKFTVEEFQEFLTELYSSVIIVQDSIKVKGLLNWLHNLKFQFSGVTSVLTMVKGLQMGQ